MIGQSIRAKSRLADTQPVRTFICVEARCKISTLLRDANVHGVEFHQPSMWGSSWHSLVSIRSGGDGLGRAVNGCKNIP